MRTLICVQILNKWLYITIHDKLDGKRNGSEKHQYFYNINILFADTLPNIALKDYL